eukprot:TRINITY_DN12802_c0_g1_i2.p1 TRINITY_DN12802_c0_g1~~TRINITY_DN12802_c0_g1_i2.p1  ORF type:complete len:195 (-),score=42.86 TRINITY_DN12802_c0_g1_i2:137-721(-)
MAVFQCRMADLLKLRETLLRACQQLRHYAVEQAGANPVPAVILILLKMAMQICVWSYDRLGFDARKLLIKEIIDSAVFVEYFFADKSWLQKAACVIAANKDWQHPWAQRQSPKLPVKALPPRQPPSLQPQEPKRRKTEATPPPPPPALRQTKASNLGPEKCSDFKRGMSNPSRLSKYSTYIATTAASTTAAATS